MRILLSIVILLTLIYAPVPNLFLKTRMYTDVSSYFRAEQKPTHLIARKWMALALEIQKKENFAAAGTARFYAYIASVYDDVLVATGDTGQASIAASQVLLQLAPKHTQEVNSLLRSLHLANLRKSPKTTGIILDYSDRILHDNSSLVWDKETPNIPYAWYIRDDTVDGGAMAGTWSTWGPESSRTIDVPPPPAPHSLADQVEIEKIRYATNRRRPQDANTIRVWQGSIGFDKIKSSDNINPSGVWQNILFIELGSELEEKTYSRIQKMLAQVQADAFIAAWHIKYTYYSMRPSMRDQNLILAIKDPPFPGYVSGHSTCSSAAATVLTYFYPQKKSLWWQNANDAKTSRLSGGIHMDIDNQMGEYVGTRVGEKYLAHIVPKEYHLSPEHNTPAKLDSSTMLLVKYILLKLANMREHIYIDF